ncbi:MAG TPA: molybdenum cofactor guanylyltransferase [Candidatus Lustribacter sp.]|jgi:molybdopterin-guanine dinucleotide biosynthesis protein A|nr:molybdenum cofactor guanylyltransferase [Candidatus Lustribacter sp.]
MPDRSSTAGVIVLAGGEAKRLPGKLYLDAGDLPLLVRVYRNVCEGRETLISTKGALPYEIDLLIDAPAVVDRWPMRGPLSGLLSTMGEMRAPWAFAVAGDAPFVDAAFIDRLEAQIQPGDEAIVPRRTRDGETQIEPLAALYLRSAFVREGLPLLSGGNRAMRTVIEHLNTRFLDVEEENVFANVNTPDDYAAIREILT